MLRFSPRFFSGRLSTLALYFLLLSSFLLLAPAASFAYDPPECVTFLPGCGNFRTFLGSDPSKNQIFTIIIPNALTWLYSLAAAVAVLLGVAAGVMFVIGGGNEEMRTKAIKTITYAIFGLLIALFAFFIVKIINVLPFPGTT